MTPDRPKVLIVEDAEDMAFLLHLNFKRWGWDSEHVETSAEAIARLGHPDTKPPHYALVLVDLMLPGGSGVNVIREARRLGLAVPIAVMTGLEFPEALKKLGDQVPDELFLKKYDIDDLRAFAAEVLDRLRATQVLAQAPGLAP